MEYREKNQAAGQEETDGLQQTLDRQCLKSHVCLSLLGVCPSAPLLKIIKTSLCSYINACIYSLSVCFALVKGVVFPRTLGCPTSVQQKQACWGGKQDQLLIELHAVETAGPGREEGNAVI